MTKKILVVAAHADDEVLGCGGTIAKHNIEGDEVFLILMADGVSSRSYGDSSQLEQRNFAAEEVAKILGIKKIMYLGFPDNRMDTLSLLEINQSLEAHILEIRPEVIYTHHYGDLNVDHRITCQSVLTACRPMPGSSVREIYAFEVMSSTEWAPPHAEPFLPSVFVDITKTYHLKMAALEKYDMEMRDYPHSRSLQHLDSLTKYRGGCVGVEAAEAFEAIRIIK